MRPFLLILPGLAVLPHALHAASAQPNLSPATVQVCHVLVRVLGEPTLDTDFYSRDAAELSAYLASIGLDRAGADYDLTCEDSAPAPATMYFEARIANVEVTSLLDPGPNGVTPVAPVAGQVVSGRILYDGTINAIARELVGTPDVGDMTAEEIDALLPGALHPIRSVELFWEGQSNTFGGYSSDADAKRTYFAETPREFTVGNYYPVGLGNNVPDAGDVFAASAVRVWGGRLGGVAVYDIVSDMQLLAHYVANACATEGDGSVFTGVDGALDLQDALSFLAAEGMSLEVSDSRPVADAASLFPGDSRTPDRTIYPTLSGAQTNRFQWTFTQVGESNAIWERITIPSAATDCATAVTHANTLAGMFPSDLTPYLAPVQGVTVTGELNYLSPTLALTAPPPTPIPLPFGGALLLAGIIAQLALRLRHLRRA